MQFYRNESSNPKWNAQRNLQGRTHYVDDDTLRYHKSRILSARHTDSGLLFAIVTSDAIDYQNTKRGFRYVIFDVFGTVLDRPTLDETYTSSERATKAMWEQLNAIDAKAHTLAAIEKQRRQHGEEMDRLAADVAKVETIEQAA
jgi:hypothetical protein